MKLNYKLIILTILVLAIILRVVLLFIAPISMFTDGIQRYLPNAEKILHGDFSFNDLPLFIIFEAFWILLFNGEMLWLAWKGTAFIFFIGILFLLPSLFKKFNLNNKERIIVMALFFFSTWSLLLSATVMVDMLIAFFTIALFLVIEKYFEKPEKKWLALSIIFSALMALTKLTGYLILAGFGLYIISKFKKTKEKIKEKMKCVFSLMVGILITLPWLIKNYLNTGMIFIHSVTPLIHLHSFSEYLQFFIRTYHYFWEFPLAEKVALTGKLAILFNVYYIGTIIITVFISALLIISTIKYCKKHGRFIWLFLPLFLFALIYWPFILLWSESDSGRYTFPLWIFLFIFIAKYVSRINKKKIRQFCHIIIILFCIVSIISAFGISLHMNSINDQIMEMSETLKQENLENMVIISNTEFGATSLSYYLGKPVQFNMPRNVVDPNVKCEGERIFESKNFDVFKKNDEYRICRN
jgi:hypothetical protein